MKPVYHYRSSVTGKLVSAAYAKRYPHLTVRERVNSPGFDAFCKGEPEKAKPQTRHV